MEHSYTTTTNYASGDSTGVIILKKKKTVQGIGREPIMWVCQAVSLIKGIKRIEECQWHRPLRMAGWLEAQICFGVVIPNRTWPGPGGVTWQENNTIQTLEVRASYRLGQQGTGAPYIAAVWSHSEKQMILRDTLGSLHMGKEVIS